MESNGFDIFKILHNQRLKNPNNIIISYLNINSIRNKIEDLKQLVTGNIDILVISETKLDDSFLTSIFEIPGFHSPIRFRYIFEKRWFFSIHKKWHNMSVSFSS